jgi:hypothetical protein
MINYQTDFYGWTQEQAGLLKATRLSELAIENLREEVETHLDKKTFPVVCPWDLSQILDDTYYPNTE